MFSSPYAERRWQREQEAAARVEKERAEKERTELERAEKERAEKERTELERAEKEKSAQQPAPQEPADGSISVQDLIKREGGHKRPRRRRALWDPRDYDELDGND